MQKHITQQHASFTFMHFASDSGRKRFDQFWFSLGIEPMTLMLLVPFELDEDRLLLLLYSKHVKQGHCHESFVALCCFPQLEYDPVNRDSQTVFTSELQCARTDTSNKALRDSEHNQSDLIKTATRTGTTLPPSHKRICVPGAQVRWGIFIEIANNTLYRSNYLMFILCQKSLEY